MDIVHYSVLKEEVYSYLKPSQDDKLMIDCTLGEGGHSELFLSRCPWLNLVGLDADSKIMTVAEKRLESYGSRVRLFNQWFNMFFKQYPLGDERPDLILFDLGISIFHYEKSGRGFSFLRDEPLDMRLAPELEISAADIVNEYPESEIADLIYQFGEERYSRRFARAIISERKTARIETTDKLAALIKSASPPDYRRGRIHPATRTFQALRIAVNGELARLDSVLANALRILKPGGRMGVITFHSLEDRMVKHFFKDMNKACICPPEQPICNCNGRKIVEILTKKPVIPTEQEISMNAPSRSSKLRVVKKISDEEF
ncbi:MAG: 16S rRNA (cytosine(1402)-N(4))-methyltransferase RsmH [Spirochaetales bacterium]|uniref:Ribosomal RNA small subunit methyltransferase H n=1 Tax=Candidatus Thalassospirochaeta sargassi TaxID=3119039 RepID=A0AAJ1IIC8_9SPIO|nr:16S rRNA (cytosine(1402)-N(4))-methyltransferase RsmH [Spirochaetales bacterium]